MLHLHRVRVRVRPHGMVLRVRGRDLGYGLAQVYRDHKHDILCAIFHPPFSPKSKAVVGVWGSIFGALLTISSKVTRRAHSCCERSPLFLGGVSNFFG